MCCNIDARSSSSKDTTDNATQEITRAAEGQDNIPPRFAVSSAGLPDLSIVSRQ